jgi:hypothetical protein
MPFAATRMDLEIIILSEESQAEKDIYDIISMLNLKKKKDANKLIYKTETDPQTLKRN